MNPANTHAVWGRVATAAAGLVALLGLNGASCLPAMEQSIDRRFAPEVIRGRDAATVAMECGTGVGTPAQVAAATAAADSARITAGQLQVLMAELKEAYAAKEAATNARVDAANQANNWAAQIADLERKAGLAMLEAGQDHNIEFMHSFHLPAAYLAPTPERPNAGSFGNANFLLVRTADSEATSGRNRVQQAVDAAAASTHATDSEKAQLQTWLDTVGSLAADVASAKATSEVQRYDTPDDLTQMAVRKAYKAIELGCRARALQMTIELRGDATERTQRAAEREAEAIAHYERLLQLTGDAQRRAQDAANAAYRAAVDCGIDTAPVVPGSPEWNSTFWQISSP